ncbi:hypothetical protein [uncultured Shewanella sp.]|uniref:hypothetical protein n=1 Tax=uncultured Shewanella sp. TaxID=173975 RepID=UPI00262A0335|nr:hypothetical protein [uncultured Shewanella sp.]
MILPYIKTPQTAIEIITKEYNTFSWILQTTLVAPFYGIIAYLWATMDGEDRATFEIKADDSKDGEDRATSGIKAKNNDTA